MLKLILQAIIAIPQILTVIREVIRVVQSQQAKRKYDKAIQKNKEVTDRVTEAQSAEEAQKALDEAAKKWTRQN